MDDFRSSSPAGIRCLLPQPKAAVLAPCRRARRATSEATGLTEERPVRDPCPPTARPQGVPAWAGPGSATGPPVPAAPIRPGGTGHRIVSARSSPSASGLRSAAHWDARKRQKLTERKRARTPCLRSIVRWLANPRLGAGSPAHHGLRARGGRRSAPRAGNGRSRNERSRPCAPSPHQRGRVAPDPKNTSLAQVRAADPEGAAAPCPCPREVGVGAAAPSQGYPLGRILDAVY
jgi:hypothetical protein